VLDCAVSKPSAREMAMMAVFESARPEEFDALTY
jgi:hypothetical protein